MSPWRNPMMITKQTSRDGKVKYRFITDMRQVNEVTVKDSFPLPRIDETLDSLGGSAYFAVVDMARGYFQVPLRKEDREKTAFSANNNLYQWCVMPLGAANAPSTFSRLMELVLKGLTYAYCLVYLDDTIIFSKNFEEHVAHCEEILERIIRANLKLRPEKCTFGTDEVGYLGFVVTTKGVRPDGDRVKAIDALTFPKTAKKMISFLGAVNFYRDFIKGFSSTASVLYKMSQSNKKFKESLKHAEVYKAFQKLKDSLKSNEVLAYPNFKLPFIVQTDASSVALGGVLGQMIDNRFTPNTYISRHLTSAETRYSATERELLAIVWAAKRLETYLYGRPVTFVTDHEPLVTMKKLKNPMGRIGRLLNKIQDLDYKLVYQPGSVNYTADLLSRPSEKLELNSIQLVVDSSVNWAAEQIADHKLLSLRSLVSSENVDLYNDLAKWSEVPNGDLWHKLRDHLSLQEEVLVLNEDHKVRVIVPKQMVSLVLNFLHDSPLAGHRDFEKTSALIGSRYFWLSMSKDIKSYCATCHLCQTKKHLGQANRAPLRPIVVSEPWTVIGIDISGPHRVTANGNAFIILAGDYHSKFCVGKALPNFTAATTAKFVFEEIICKFGTPKTIISDHGVNFMAKMFGELCNLCGIKRANSSFYHPAGNGLIERMIKSLKQILTMFVDSSHANWDNFLQASLSAYNTSVHSSLKFAPYEVLFGRKPIVLADVILSNPVVVKESDMSSYVSSLKSNAARLNKVVNSNLSKAYERQKTQYDKFVHDNLAFNVGDLVLVRNERNLAGESKCFKNKAIGPFQITSKFNFVNFKIVELKSGKEQVIHYNRLIPYRQRVDETRLEDEKVGTEKASDLDGDFKTRGGYFDEEAEILSQYLLFKVLLGSPQVDPSRQMGLIEESDRSLGGVRGDDVEIQSSQCHLCAKTFTSTKWLEKHVDSCHNTQTDLHIEAAIQTVVAAGSAADDPNKAPSEGLVNCDGCKRFFKGDRGLKTHSRSCRAGNEPQNETLIEVGSGNLEESLYS